MEKSFKTSKGVINVKGFYGQVKSSTRKHLSTSNVKGQPNLTAAAFCFWVNEELLPNACLEPGFPRKTSVETARQWMHELGFEVLSASKGAYYDGHERDDVVQYRGEFLKTDD